MKVQVPTPLRSYTADRATVDAQGETLALLLQDLDSRYPGFRFRIIDEQDHIREHVRIFVNQQNVASLESGLRPDDRVSIIMAISGG